jgi:hypothetical protein
MSGVYKLTCPDCNKAYIGHTGRPFAVRFREHYRDYTHAHIKSKFAHYLLDQHHSIGPMNTTMDIIHIATKGRMLNILERLHIYKETIDNQINDKHTIRPNVIFDTITRYNPDSRHST